MTTATPVSRVKVARVNRIVLNRGADLFFEGEHVFVPFGNHSAKALPGVMESIGADAVIVEYRTIPDPKERARDLAKFTKRVAALYPTYNRGPWSPRVIDGHTHENVIVCTLTRLVPLGDL